MTYPEHFIKSARFEFKRYKTLGDKTFAQLSDQDMLWQYQESNSIAIIVKHIVGNMLSRWTNFLTEDGEKSWRNREMEFKDPYRKKEDLVAAWEEGWQCLFTALDSIDHNNFDTPIRIRTEEHSIVEAVHRQLAHYANHVGQIVFIGTMIKGEEWKSLSIPKGGSEEFNQRKMNS
ncbi:DUF1572 family protein [Spongiimicrobium salis]|uniref:DUF1572 family protein n=1 Tax=Spongiimicrobium salis TaxID=1667022 RepID=UPI00374D7CE9